MIYLLFTQEGLQQALSDIITDKAALWVNDGVLTEQQKVVLADESIEVSILPQSADPQNEKSVVAAIEYVEKASPNTEILVEYL